MSNRVSNLITLDLVKKLRNIKNLSSKNYSYETQKILADEINKVNGGVNGEINKVNGEINKVNSVYDDFLFIHKYGLEVWLKS